MPVEKHGVNAHLRQKGKIAADLGYTVRWMLHRHGEALQAAGEVLADRGLP